MFSERDIIKRPFGLDIDVMYVNKHCLLLATWISMITHHQSEFSTATPAIYQDSIHSNSFLSSFHECFISLGPSQSCEGLARSWIHINARRVLQMRAADKRLWFHSFLLPRNVYLDTSRPGLGCDVRSPITAQKINYPRTTCTHACAWCMANFRISKGARIQCVKTLVNANRDNFYTKCDFSM